MPFDKMRPKMPPRLWALVGFPDDGKSTFAARMAGPILAIDADHRFADQLPLNPDILELSNVPQDNCDTDRIASILNQCMPGAKVGTIVIDSLTAIIAPLVGQAMADKDHGRIKNLSAGFKGKAMAMRRLQDCITRWGTDVLWIYHLQAGRDGNAKEVITKTVSRTELIRLRRSINAELEIVRDKEARGIKVVWCRSGRSGMTIWDKSGSWASMPEQLETAMYGGLSEQQRKEIETKVPEFFPNPEAAIAWGYEQGCFEAIHHARNAYDKCRREKSPKNAKEMASHWIADVHARMKTSESDQETEYEPLPGEQEHPQAPAPDTKVAVDQEIRRQQILGAIKWQIDSLHNRKLLSKDEYADILAKWNVQSAKTLNLEQLKELDLTLSRIAQGVSKPETIPAFNEFQSHGDAYEGA